MKKFWFVFIFTFSLFLVIGCSEKIPDDMKVYTNEYFNISTLLREDWTQVYSPDIDHNTLMFRVSNKEEIDIIKQENTYYLEDLYEESESYEQFIEAYVTKLEEESSTNIKKIHTLNKKIPIYAYATKTESYVFSVIEIEDTPLLLLLSISSENPDLESIKELESYSEFTKMINHTKPLEDGV
ncbi:hypothetical protein NC661_08925 [Aquibacillus koreensis]|uniref:Uncharacterized protein n=1 Tax=Aquibacillus koreensis TaxID=279446 RepID=A0A9X4AHV0_9BACI|nr:hypothetical protein [Aquibacillus koreensis]MCT2536032.1 hypothetical protein [Aquibacillus koreensis]MDC3420487.1 hypothetical protein [Aquibacillus koreensis]